MKHFVQNDKFNAFRLPVGWQFLVNNVVGGKLDEGNFAKYDALMKACLATGAHCIIDIHNYARWDGAIIGQGGPTNDQFADLWSQLMTHYAAEPNVVVGMVNEPHDSRSSPAALCFWSSRADLFSYQSLTSTLGLNPAKLSSTPCAKLGRKNT